MKLRVACIVVGFLSLVLSLAAQTSSSSSAVAQVPPFIQFSNVATDVNGKPLTGVVGITFSLYQEQQGGSPLWLETQSVQPDKTGHYTVLLGSTTSQGLPNSIFTAGEAHWLGVQMQGQEEQPRVMLLSVPYALKAGDAQTLGGLPASAFVLAAPAPSGSGSTAGGDSLNPSTSPVVVGSGTADFLPLWTNLNVLGNSVLFQSGSGSSATVGINTTTPAATLDVNGGVISRGALQLPSTGTATASQGFNSQPFSLQGSAFNSSTGKAIGPLFQWQTEPSGNDSQNPAGTLNLLYGNGSGSPTETGLNIASNGQITFATGQTFPGTGTVTSVGSGAGLTGGPITGSGTLSIATGGVTNAMLANPSLTVAAGTDLTGGGVVALGGSTTLNLDTTMVPQLNTANTFTGNQTVNGNVAAINVTATNVTTTATVSGSVVNANTSLDLAGSPFAYGAISSGNVFLGFGAGNFTTTGVGNTASGESALGSDTTGTYNTASGVDALVYTTTGSANTASGVDALASNTTGSYNTANGVDALVNNTTGNYNTAIGAGALDGSTGFQNGSYDTAVGYEALYSNSPGDYDTAVGYEALYSNSTGDSNTAVGYQALFNNTTGSLNTAIGEAALQANTIGTDNVASGNSALAANTTGVNNVATGVAALSSNTTGNDNVANGIFALVTNNGSDNTAIGTNALRNNTTGSENTGLGMYALQSNTTGNDLTCVGYDCTATDNLQNATAIGAHATVEVSDALVLGGTGAYAVKVGIGTTTPSNVLTIAQGAGHPLSDGWTTYSSRRWKTNIQTLHGALGMVEQLRGVSYDLKDSGKHEVGVIAEEVGAVVPEVVSYEENGKDARGVDYSRLTALLIEAVKQQQREISALRGQLQKRAAKEAALESRLEQLEQHNNEMQLASARPVR